MTQARSVEVDASAPGRLAVGGALIFETARQAHEAGLRAIEAATVPELEVNCAGVSESDSAGLVVLLDWLAVAARRGLGMRFIQLPETLLAMARISEIEALLAGGQPAGARS